VIGTDIAVDDIGVVIGRLELTQTFKTMSVRAEADRESIYVTLETDDPRSDLQPMYQMAASLTVAQCRALIRGLESAIDIHQEDAENAQ
jgi:hypothetical protein